MAYDTTASAQSRRTWIGVLALITLLGAGCGLYWHNQIVQMRVTHFGRNESQEIVVAQFNGGTSPGSGSGGVSTGGGNNSSTGTTSTGGTASAPAASSTSISTGSATTPNTPSGETSANGGGSSTSNSGSSGGSPQLNSVSQR